MDCSRFFRAVRCAPALNTYFSGLHSSRRAKEAGEREREREGGTLATREQVHYVDGGGDDDDDDEG